MYLYYKSDHLSLSRLKLPSAFPLSRNSIHTFYLAYNALWNLNLPLSQTSSLNHYPLVHFTLVLPSLFLSQGLCTYCFFYLGHFLSSSHLPPSQHSDFSSNVTSLKWPFPTTIAKVAHPLPHPSCCILLFLYSLGLMLSEMIVLFCTHDY